MTISEQIQKDMVDAMRSRDELRLSTLRMVKSALSYKEVEKRAPLDVVGRSSADGRLRGTDP